jgi:hypothetical protein
MFGPREEIIEGGNCINVNAYQVLLKHTEGQKTTLKTQAYRGITILK